MSGSGRLRLDVLPAAQRELWPRLRLVPGDFVLYGGTGLALRLGHRTSVDFDFFSSRPFVPGELRATLSPLGRGGPIRSITNTLVLDVAGVRLSFFGDLSLAVVGRADVAGNGIRVASIDDLAGTKLKVILDQAETKDYLDLAALLRHGIALERMVADAVAIFGVDFDAMLALKALTSSDDAGLDDLPDAVRDDLRSAAAAVRSIPVVPRLRERI